MANGSSLLLVLIIKTTNYRNAFFKLITTNKIVGIIDILMNPIINNDLLIHGKLYYFSKGTYKLYSISAAAFFVRTFY